MNARSHSSLWGFLVAIALALPATADPEGAFKKAIEAADLKRWQEAAQQMRAAIAEDPRESGKRIFLSGVFSRPYLPHFYLGWILFNTGQDHCEAALEAWERSEAQGKIQDFKRQHQELRDGRKVCNDLLLPSAMATATAQIERAAARDQEIAELPPSPGQDLGSAREALAAARKRFEDGQANSRLSAVRQAEEQARTAEELLAQILAQRSKATPPPAQGEESRAEPIAQPSSNRPPLERPPRHSRTRPSCRPLVGPFRSLSARQVCKRLHSSSRPRHRHRSRTHHRLVQDPSRPIQSSQRLSGAFRVKPNGC